MDEWLEVNVIMKKRKLPDDENICLMPSQMWNTTIFQRGFEEPEVCVSFEECCSTIKSLCLWLSILPVGCFRTGYGLCWLMLNISNILC